MRYCLKFLKKVIEHLILMIKLLRIYSNKLFKLFYQNLLKWLGLLFLLDSFFEFGKNLADVLFVLKLPFNLVLIVIVVLVLYILYKLIKVLNELQYVMNSILKDVKEIHNLDYIKTNLVYDKEKYIIFCRTYRMLLVDYQKLKNA